MAASLLLISRIEEFAAECILADSIAPKSVVFMIAQRFSQATGLEIIFALVSIADAILKWIPDNQTLAEFPSSIHKACALLGADLYGLEKSGKSPATGSDLIEYWGNDDPFFHVDQNNVLP